jgi:hypothetical protein
VQVEPGVEWLLSSAEPAIAYLARRDLLGDDTGADAERILSGPIVRALLRGQKRDGGFGVHAYKKWTGAHWRLVSLVELAVPAGEPRAVAAADTVLQWLTGAGHRRGVKVVGGLARRCASMEGNALAVCCRLGLAEDPRVTLLAESLVEWQWPDGGWNCDLRASGRRSSFHESLPPYWHYDVPQALLVLSRLGRVRDPRAREALDLLVGLQRDDGRWHAGKRWWRAVGGDGTGVEAVDWGRRGPSEMITLNALRILRSAGRVAEPTLATA